MMPRSLESPPSGALVTDQDQRNFPLYLRVFDAIQQGATYQDVARTVFGFAKPTSSDCRIIKRYYKRAVWLTGIGWRQITPDLPATIAYGVFTSSLAQRRGLSPWRDTFATVAATQSYRDFVGTVVAHATAQQSWPAIDQTAFDKVSPASDDLRDATEGALSRLLTHTDHPLWPPLVFVALAHVIASSETQKAHPGKVFFITALAKALKERDAASLAKVLATLPQAYRDGVVAAVIDGARQAVWELFCDSPSDATALVQGPLDALDQPKSGLHERL
jgi:hypothetical protein